MPKRIPKRLLFSIILVLLWRNVPGIVMLSDSVSENPISNQEIFIYTDHNNSIEFKKLLEGKQQVPFSPLNSSNLEPVHKGFHWLKILVIDKSSADKNWVLETRAVNIKALEAWIPDTKGNYHLQGSGLDNSEVKTYRNRNPVFNLPSGAKNYIIFLKVSSPNRVKLELKIRSHESFTWHVLQEHMLLGSFYGVLLAMLVWGLYLFCSRLKQVYLLFSLLIFSCLYLSLAADGLGAQFIWSSYASGNLHFYYFLAPQLLLVASVLFARSFLDLKLYFPLGDNILLAVSGVILSLMVLHSSGIDFSIPFWYLIPYLLILICAVVSFFKGFKPARLFILAYLFVTAGGILFHLNLDEKIESSFFHTYIINVAILFLAAVLSFALADRRRVLGRQSESAEKSGVSSPVRNEHTGIAEKI